MEDPINVKKNNINRMRKEHFRVFSMKQPKTTCPERSPTNSVQSVLALTFVPSSDCYLSAFVFPRLKYGELDCVTQSRNSGQNIFFVVLPDSYICFCGLISRNVKVLKVKS